MRTGLWILATLAAAFLAGCGSTPPAGGSDAGRGGGLDAAGLAADAASDTVPADAGTQSGFDAASPPGDASDLSEPDATAGLPDSGEPGLDAAGPWDAEAPGLDAGGDAGGEPDGGPRCIPECQAGEACLETTCVAVSFDALCSLGRATVLKDGQAVDDEVSASLGQAVASRCGAGFEVASASLSDPAVFDPTGKRLLTPRKELAISAGGFFFNPLVGALEKARKSPLYFTSGAGGIGWASSATGWPVHLFPESEVTDTHDYFVVELFPDGDGRLVLVDYGIGAAGTRAAGRQAEAMLAVPGSFTDTWYVYEWSLDADAGAETVSLVLSGR